MSAELLDLPWEIQVSLASGYAAYMIAYVGLRNRHRAIDTAFITLVFGLLATGVLAITNTGNAILTATLAFVVTCFAGVIWRKWGQRILRSLLRAANISWSDDDPSALATLSTNTRYPVTQIAVLLDDGTWLRCDDTSEFNDAPFGPCLLGPSGDVALYLTHEEARESEPKKLKTVRDPDYGDRLTYVPANRIRRITVRHLSGT